MRSASPIDRRWTVVPPVSRETSRTGEGEATSIGWPVTQVICRNVSTGRSNGKVRSSRRSAAARETICPIARRGGASGRRSASAPRRATAVPLRTARRRHQHIVPRRPLGGHERDQRREQVGVDLGVVFENDAEVGLLVDDPPPGGAMAQEDPDFGSPSARTDSAAGSGGAHRPVELRRSERRAPSTAAMISLSIGSCALSALDIGWREIARSRWRIKALGALKTG